MNSGAALRVNGVWCPIDGIQSGLQAQAERPGSEFSSLGGVRHAQSARRAPRTWSVDLGHAGPESVALLATAAAGDGGDVWLWDEAAARANLLDPLAVRGRDGYPTVMCGSVPLRSLTIGPGSGGSGGGPVVDVPAAANVILLNEPPESTNTSPGVAMEAGYAETLIRFNVPPTPAGLGLFSAHLVLSADVAGDGIDAHVAASSWVESTAATDYWSSVPAGALLGSASWAAGQWVIDLGDLTAFEGGPLSMRLAVDSATAYPTDRAAAAGFPVLRMTYSLLAEDRLIDQHLRAGSYLMSAWTDAPGGTVVGSWSISVGGVTYAADIRVDGTNPGAMRWAKLLLAADAAGTDWSGTVFGDLDVTFTVFDSDDYLLAGLMVSTLEHPDVYLHPHKTPVRVKVDDPTVTLDSLWEGEQGRGPRSVTIGEVGA